MNRGMIGSALIGIWLGCVTAAAVQLPPEIEVDRYLLRADRLMEADDAKGALEVMGKIVELQKEHGLTLPNEFHFKHAKVAMSAGSVPEALDAVNTYLLAAGRESKFYREALELLEDAEERQDWIQTRQTCAGQPKGTSCWMEVTGHPDCFVWNPNLQPDETVTWTSGCAGRQAQGEGTLKWVWDGGKETSESTGNLKEGKMHGQWVERWKNGGGAEGPYVEGKRHGQWVVRLADGGVQEGPYVEGKRHGQWVVRLASGSVHEGPYVKGKMHGQWVVRGADGTVHEGSYVEGKMHGQWVERDADGTVQESPLSVLAGAAGSNTEARATTVGDSGDIGVAAGVADAPCLIPNFPNDDPKSVTDIEIPWCPSGGPQVESFAQMAVVYQCSLSMLEDPEKIREVRGRIAEYCKRLDGMKQPGGDWHCQCPPGFGQ